MPQVPTPEIRPEILQALASELLNTHGRYTRDLNVTAYRAWLDNGNDVAAAAAEAIEFDRIGRTIELAAKTLFPDRTPPGSLRREA